MPANRKFDISNSPPLITSALTFIVLDCSLEGGAPRTFPIAMELSVDVDNELVGLFVLVVLVLATSVDSIPFLSFFEDCFPFAFVVLAFGGTAIFMDGDTFSATLTLSPTVIVVGLDFFVFDAGTIFSAFSFFNDIGVVFFDLVLLLLLLIVFPGVGGFCCVVVLFITLLRFISSRRYLRWVSSAAILSRDWMRARVSLR
jgi:hypothetical protein